MADPIEHESSIEPRKSLRPSSHLLSRPLPVPDKLLRIPSYQIEVTQTSVGSINKGHLKMIEIYPPESIASLILSDSKRKETFQIPVTNISDIQVISEVKGRKKKGENLMIQIKFRGEDGLDNSIKIDLEDKYIKSLMQDVAIVRNNVYDKTCWSPRLLTYTTDNNESKTVDFYPFAPFLAEGEEVIWCNIVTEGLINKKATWIKILTNCRVFDYTFKQHAGTYALLSVIEDVLVTNKRRTSDSSSIGSYGRSRYHLSGTSSGRTTSTTIGDVDFIAGGKVYIKFAGVTDPDGLAAVVKSLRKQQAKIQIASPVQTEIEANQSKTPLNERTSPEDSPMPIEEPSLNIQDTPSDENSQVEKARYTCIQCGYNNPVGSKFCNKCGSQLLPLCPICGSSNPNDATFCNQCGSKINR